jgi:hypothetical protein
VQLGECFEQSFCFGAGRRCAPIIIEDRRRIRIWNSQTGPAQMMVKPKAGLNPGKDHRRWWQAPLGARRVGGSAEGAVLEVIFKARRFNGS